MLDSLWQNYPICERLKLNSLGKALPFCDGIGVPRTPITQTLNEVKQNFQQNELKIHTLIPKNDSWFVKFDEDCMPSMRNVKKQLKAMSDKNNEFLSGRSEFFFKQIDQTEEFGGFFYCKEPKKLVQSLGKLGLKQQKDYHSTSFCLNLDAGNGMRVKIYNKTLHPLFAAESVMKKIGMGGKQFFQSSNFFHSRVVASQNTGRLRIEVSNYFKTREEEQKWLLSEEKDLIQKIVRHLRKYAKEWIKEIPFDAMWNAFWIAPGAHIFLEDTKKAAVVYAYNQESRQYIGGLLDISQKKDLNLFHKEHSIYGKEALVVRNGEVVEKFVKEDNLHCFPIFPRLSPKNTWRHPFKIPGWDYYLDCRNVVLRQLKVSKRNIECFSINEEEEEEQSSLLIPYSEPQLARITVQQVMEDGLEAVVIPKPATQSIQASDVIIANYRPAFIAIEEYKIDQNKKREQKDLVKRIQQAAKEQARANRDEDMDFFAVYYKNNYQNMKFCEFKKLQTHPNRIKSILRDDTKAKKAHLFVENQRKIKKRLKRQ